ncbi:MAG: hypothetical protein ACT4PN_14545 [Nitrospiraceae bacterium]
MVMLSPSSVLSEELTVLDKHSQYPHQRITGVREHSLVVAGIVFSELSPQTLQILDDVKLPLHSRTCDVFQCALGNHISVNEFAYAEKCNAVLLIADLNGECDNSILDSYLEAWCKLTNNKARRYISSIPQNTILKYGQEAYRYLIETAVGLHSVVIGDSQVYSQILNPIKQSANKDSNSTLNQLFRLMKKAERAVQEKTQLHRGYTSLERLACSHICKKLDEKLAIAVVGLGSSGSLVTKILCEEYKRTVYVANRNQAKCNEAVRKYGAKQADFHPPDFLKEVGGLVLALDNSAETRTYAEYLQSEISSVNTIQVLIDLAAPPLTQWALHAGESIDISGLSEMAKSVLNKRETCAEEARCIIEDIVKKIFLESTLHNSYTSARK